MENKLKTNIIYNSIGNIIFLAFQWLTTILVVRLSGYKDAGILSLSMSFANSLYALASFGMRGYQASDTEYLYNNKTYIKSRLITCIVGNIIFTIFILLNDYNVYTKSCIIVYLIYKSVEAFDDIYYGALQREWNMKQTGISYAIHGIAMIISFILGLTVFKSLLISFILMLITSILITIFYDKNTFNKYCKKDKEKTETLKKLLITCLPLVCYAFLFNNIQVYPKYILERISGEEILGIYSSIAAPVLLIQVVAGFLFNPLLNVFKEKIDNNDQKSYKQLINKVYSLILILGILGVVYIFLFGDFSLKILFGTNILEYSNLLYSTLIVALLLSIISFNNMLLTISRKFKILIIQNVISLLLSVVISKHFIIKYSIYGINTVLIISLLIGIVICLKDIYNYEKKESGVMRKIKNFIIKFGAKHSKFILKYVPDKIIRKIEKIVNSNSNNFERTTKIDNNLKKGINFVGHIKGQYGLGQGARLLVKALDMSKLDYNAIDVNMGSTVKHNDTEYDNILKKDFPYTVNLFHVQPYTSFEVGLSQIEYTKNLENRYNIGYWVYETEDIPKKWSETFKYVNEIWTPSDFATNAFKKISPIPVYTVPYGIEVKKDDKLKRKDFNIPENKFAFLIMYDPRSLAERKNPKAAIKAYLEAFNNNNKVCLVIVLNNASDEEINNLEKELVGIENYTLINKTMPKSELYALISLCDVYVSLHRSEGFGLIMAEAMSLGTVCIATNYSGNLQFMNEDNSCLVKYKMIEVDTTTQSVYEKGNRWADADIKDASKYMLKLYKDKKYYNKLRENAKKTMENDFSIEASAKNIVNRFKNIIKENNL